MHKMKDAPFNVQNKQITQNLFTNIKFKMQSFFFFRPYELILLVRLFMN